MPRKKAVPPKAPVAKRTRANAVNTSLRFESPEQKRAFDALVLLMGGDKTETVVRACRELVKAEGLSAPALKNL